MNSYLNIFHEMFPRQHFIANQSNAPHIPLFGILILLNFVEKDLWGGIDGSPILSSFPNSAVFIIIEPKITKFDVLISSN